MAIPSVTNTFTNGATSDGPQVSQNFTDLITAMTDGLKDFTINALTLNGPLTATTIVAPSGTAALPSISFSAGGGIFSSGANKVALTTGSTKIFEISSIGANVTSGQLFTQNGTASAPGICVGQAGNVGLYLVSSGIGFVTAGTQYGSLSSAGAWTLGSGTATEHALNTLLAANAAGVCTLTNGPSGKSGNPTGWISINVNGSSARVIPYW